MADVRTTRLRNDEQRLRQLVAANPGRLAILSTQGNPPHTYEILFRVRGIVGWNLGGPRFGNEHRAIIRIPPTYPSAGVSAEVRFQTPLLHPHVFSSGAVCTGYSRSVSEFLDLFVVRVYNVIRWDPALMNPASPADLSCLRRFQRGEVRTPLDEPLLLPSATPSKPSILWMDQ
ncbi:MAG: hypothetical protein ACK41F_00310 [Fimbriimonadaceae bacterium]